MTATITATDLEGLERVHRGKVRDVYAVGDDLLIVATDRVSAYDSVLRPGIPDKGRVLTSLSVFWFERLAGLVPHHLITAEVDRMPPAVRRHAGVLRGRALLVRRLRMFPVECVVRGYLAGSGWKDYQRTGAVCGQALPPGLPQSARLDPPLFTPATKATEGHDENVDFAHVERVVGRDAAAELRGLSLALYEEAAAWTRARGILLADSKLEFGRDAAGRIVLGDEAFTPDSSRFWDAASWQPGRPQQPFDKQLVRDWLDARGWDRTPPAPELDPDVVARTRRTYREIHHRITGRELDA